MKLRGILAMAGVLAVLLAAWFAIGQRGAPQAAADRPFVWKVDMDEVRSLDVSLPQVGKAQAWIKADGGEWHFDTVAGPPVDDKRWGSGIPLLVSALKAERLAGSAMDQNGLAVFGLEHPGMLVHIGLAGARTIDVEVGARSPDGSGDYVRLAASADVYLAHFEWRDVLERLVLDPPVTKAGG